jgi:DNA-binding winged helix-turn-helix (wHTH) protein
MQRQKVTIETVQMAVETYHAGSRNITEEHRSMRFLFGDCELDIERYELRRAGQTVALEPKAFKVLTYLVQRHGRAVVKDDLCQEFWPGTSADSYKEYSLRNCLNKIRQVVGDAGTQGVVIETLRSYGYRFAAPVTIVPTAPEEAAPPPKSPANSPLSPAPPAQCHPLPGRRQLTVLCCSLAATARLEVSILMTFEPPCRRSTQPANGPCSPLMATLPSTTAIGSWSTLAIPMPTRMRRSAPCVLS